MRFERLQTGEEEHHQKKFLPNTFRAGATAAVLTVGTLLPIHAKTAVAYGIDNFPGPNIPVLSEGINQSKKVSDFLDNDEARVVLSLALGASIAGLTNAYLLSGKHKEENAKKILRAGGPALAAATCASFLVDSIETIPPEIPGALVIGASLMMAAHSIWDTYEHEINPKIRASALATAGLILATGVSVFTLLSDKI